MGKRVIVKLPTSSSIASATRSMDAFSKKLHDVLAGIKIERNRRRRHRRAHEKAWKAQTRADGRAAHGIPGMRRLRNQLERWRRDQEIQKRKEEWGRGR